MTTTATRLRDLLSAAGSTQKAAADAIGMVLGSFKQRLKRTPTSPAEALALHRHFACAESRALLGVAVLHLLRRGGIVSDTDAAEALGAASEVLARG